MKKLLIIIVLCIVGYFVYSKFLKKPEPPREKPVPVAVSQHSAGFNASMSALLNSYYSLTAGFVNWDEPVVQQAASSVSSGLEALPLDDLKKDTTIYQTALFPVQNAKDAVGRMLKSADWNEKRQALQELSDNLRMLLLTVKYDQSIAYWQECPMAFGDGHAGNWISSSPEVVNPYLGNKDPKYGKTMLNCGETKTTINFTGVETPKL